MTWKSALFRQFYIAQGSPNAAATYAVNLRKADAYCGGLDEKIAEIGPDGFLQWIENETFGGLDSSRVRSAIRKYVGFVSSLESELIDELLDDAEVAEASPGSVFRYEKELQNAVRAQIGTLETGLVIIDGGAEKAVSTGRIDILARDADGRTVVIELKAGLCPKGAIEQLLGYASDIDDSTEGQITSRAILIAGEFSERTLAAAKRVQGLKLMTYGINVSFSAAS